MAVLATFNILTRSNLILPVSGVGSNPTMTPRLVHNGKVTTFGLSANEVNGGMGGIFSVGVVDAGTPANSIVVEAKSYYTTPPTANSVLALHDQVTKTMGRHDPRLTTFMEWWDTDLVGFPLDIIFNGASGDNFITVSDFGLLTVGQAISSTAGSPIPLGTKITGLHMGLSVAGTIPIFTVRLSKNLAAIATNAAATLTGGFLIARIPAADYAWHGVGTPASVN